MESVVPQAPSLVRAADALPRTEVQSGAGSAILPYADIGRLYELADCWWSLVDTACEANAFYEPWQLIPALDNLAPRNTRIEIAVAAAEGDKLDGLVPVVAAQRRSPRWLKSIWTHLHCMDSTPLVRAGREDAFFSALFSWMASSGTRILRWPRLRVDGSLGRHLLGFLDRTGRAYASIAEHERPTVFVTAHDQPRSGRLRLSRGRRRSLSRRRRRLEEAGDLAFRSYAGADVPDTALPRFIDLEAKGWKGRAGTAIVHRPDENAFLAAALCQSVARESVFAHSLELDGRPIAMTLNYRSGEGVWAFKTAYDERFRSYAPGILLEVWGIQAALADPAVAWLDSCSDCDNALLSELCPDRRGFADLLIAVDARASGRELRMAAAAERAWRAARGTVKRAYRSLR